MANEQTPHQSPRVDYVGRSGIYPLSGPWPSGDASIVGQGELAHPEERHRGDGAAGQIDETALLGLGRAVFGGYFLYSGINHFLNRKMLRDYAREKGVAQPDAAVLASGALILLGGLSLLTGVQPKLGACMIAAFLLGVSPKMHNFWAVEDEQQRMQEFVNFTKNMALVGGACLAAAVPEPWPASMHLGTRDRALTSGPILVVGSALA